MDTERSTKTFTTPGGHTVVMFDYITGGEMQQIARKAKNASADYGTQIDAGNETMLTLVRSLDDSDEKLLERILALPLPDYNAISTEVQAVIAPDPK